MLSFSARRVGVIAAPALLGAFVLASCGDADGAATVSTIELSEGSTAFVVRPPATTQPEVQPEEADGVVSTEQEYVVQSGDTPIGVANRYGVTLDDLVAYNEWGSAANFPFPGTTIRIPPGGTPAAPAEPAAGDGAGTAEPAETGDGETATGGGEPGATIPDVGDNCAAGSYTIEENDIPIRVAEKFDVTVDALNAANANTSGYSAFYVGLEIVIPAKADC